MFWPVQFFFIKKIIMHVNIGFDQGFDIFWKKEFSSWANVMSFS